MTTETQTLPTDAELTQWARRVAAQDKSGSMDAYACLKACADALERRTPAPVWADMMSLIDAYAEARHVGGCHTYNVKTAEARAKVVNALRTPQAQAGAVPLTPEQAQDLIELESWGPDAIGLNAQLLRTIRRTEAAHGIKGGQHADR